MLIHLTPTFINSYKNITVNLKTLIISTDKNQYIINPTILTVKKPFPNKHYCVACRKRGNKAFNGLFINIKDDTSIFSVTEEWVIKKQISDFEPIETLYYHHINFYLLDAEFDAVSQDMLIWSNRRSEIHQDWIPVSCQPKMEFDTNILGRGARAKQGHIQDGYYFNGEIKQRVEEYHVPTISSQYLINPKNHIQEDRVPDINLDIFNF